MFDLYIQSVCYLPCRETSDGEAESTVTWNGVSSYSDTVYAYQTLGYSYWSTFDITNLALKWKSGELNGQCGLIMVANDESQYIVTCSTDYTYSTLWPYVVVTYSIDLPLNYYAKDVQVDSSFTLMAYGEDGQILNDVTWISSDTSIATVSSSGLVTGIKAGTVSITASNVDGYSTPCIVHVTIPSGVYRIRNKLSGKFMGVADIDASTLSKVTQQSVAASGAEYLAQLWWIDCIGNGHYRFRPMHNLSQALDVFTDGRLCISTVYFPLENTESDMCWDIEYSGTGYVIRNGSYQKQAISPQSSSTAVGAAIVSSKPAILTDSFRWELEHIEGLFLHDSSNYCGITSGATIYMEYDTCGHVVEPLVSGDGANLQYSSSDTSVATIDSSGYIEALKRGKTTITVSATINKQCYKKQFVLFVQETISVTSLIDPTISDDIYQLIDDAVEYLNKAYQETFFLRFIVDGAPYLYPLAAVDECPLGSGEDCDNACGRDCSEHHKNVNRIAGELYENFWERNHIVVMWSNCPDRVFCYESDNGVHSLTWANALVTPYDSSLGHKDFLPVIQVLRIDGADAEEWKKYMSVTLAHEVAHTLGLQEIYLDWYGDSEGSHGAQGSALCIMRASSDEYLSIYEKNPSLCEYCTNKLHEEIGEGDLYEP